MMRRLLSAGVDPRLLADASGLDLEAVLRLHPGAVAETLTEEALRQRALRLGNAALERAHHLLFYGGMRDQVNLIKTLVPSMVKAAPDSGGDPDDELRERFAELMEEARADAPDAPVDGQDQGGDGRALPA